MVQPADQGARAHLAMAAAAAGRVATDPTALGASVALVETRPLPAQVPEALVERSAQPPGPRCRIRPKPGIRAVPVDLQAQQTRPAEATRAELPEAATLRLGATAGFVTPTRRLW